MKILTVIAFSAFVLLNFSGCFSVTDDAEESLPAPDIDILTEEVENNDTFIPESAITGKEFFAGQLDAFRHNWYRSQLKIMEEDALFDMAPDDKLKFRFLWLRSFHKPYVVRGFQAKDGKFKLHMKGTDGSGGHNLGKKVDDVFVHLTKSQSQDMVSQLRALNICDTTKTRAVGTDGAQWVFEVSDGGRYCVVDIWSPEKSSPFHSFGLLLLKTTRVKTWEIEVY